MFLRFAKDSRRHPAALPSEAFVALVHAERGQMSARQRAEGAQSLVARLAWDRGAGRRRGSWVPWAMGFAVAAAVAIVAAVQWHGARALSYAIEGGRVEPSGSITPLTADQPTLRFSDGTEVRLGSGTKASLRSVDGHGARLSLTEGTAQVEVAHVRGARWLFDAGPFLIAVTGTAFTVEWRSGDEQLDVRMQRGSVQVSGPLSDEATVLGAGQHLTVRMRQRETLIRGIDDEANHSPPPVRARDSGAGGAPSSASALNLATSPRPSRPVEGVASGRKLPVASDARTGVGVGNVSWEAELASGDFETIIRQAERIGLETCLGEATSADLAALADAARYGRHDEIARRALLAQRRRFPLSSPATDAAFLLGRLEEAEQHGAEAIDWYDRYLAEAAAGTYASEALGRKMTLTQRFYGDDRARAVASDYVDRFPQGTYAARARSLARMP